MSYPIAFLIFKIFKNIPSDFLTRALYFFNHFEDSSIKLINKSQWILLNLLVLALAQSISVF